MSKKVSHAVALRYDPAQENAPRVLAKGSGHVAEKIVAAAQRLGIPLVADPTAGALVSQAELGAEIVPEFYQAVAEVLAFVYRLDRGLEKD